MLHNPNWDKSNPYSVASFIAWLEKQPPDKEYSPLNWKTCAMGQYFIAMTGSAAPSGMAAEKSASIMLKTLYAIAVPKYWGERDMCTFGAALKRARKELKHETAAAYR